MIGVNQHMGGPRTMELRYADLARELPASTLEHGRRCHAAGHVIEAQVRVHPDSTIVTGRVAEPGAPVYMVFVEVRERDRQTTGAFVDGSCDCPSSHNCGHVVAVLLEAFAAGSRDDTRSTAPPTVGTTPWPRPWLRLLASGVQRTATPWFRAGTAIPCRATLTFDYAGTVVDPDDPHPAPDGTGPAIVARAATSTRSSARSSTSASSGFDGG